MDTTATGVLAQNVEELFPELVARDDRGFRTVDLSTLSFYVIEAMKEIWQTILAMRERVDTKELCLEDVCITADELRILLENQSAAVGPAIIYGTNNASTEEGEVSDSPLSGASSTAEQPDFGVNSQSPEEVDVLPGVGGGEDMTSSPIPSPNEEGNEAGVDGAVLAEEESSAANQ
jgi:hypothetical protein